MNLFFAMNWQVPIEILVYSSVALTQRIALSETRMRGNNDVLQAILMSIQ